MAEIKSAPQAYAAPVPARASGEQYIQRTPAWVLVARIAQVVFSFVLLIMCGYLIHGKALDANVFTVVVCVMTWIVVAYALVSEKVPGANGAYNIWAILSLDLFMAIMWLASLGANAALRSSFKYDVTIDSCYNDGSAVNSNFCTVSKREMLEKRAAVAGSVALAVMSAIAGVSVIPFLLFIATLIFHGHTFRLHHQAKTTPAADNATVEMKAQQTPMLAAHANPTPVPPFTEYPSQTQPQAYPQPQPQAYAQAQPQAYPQTYPQPQPTPSPAPVSTPSPVPYELAQNHPNQGSYQLPGSQPYAGHYQQQQQAYIPSPQGTPAPGQPYYPPAQ